MPQTNGSGVLILFLIVRLPACLFIGYLVIDGIRSILLRRRLRRRR